MIDNWSELWSVESIKSHVGTLSNYDEIIKSLY